MLKQVLIGGGVAVSVFTICREIGLPSPVGIIVAVVLFLMFAIAKPPDSRSRDQPHQADAQAHRPARPDQDL
jgi:hypothetical protein